MSSRKRKPTTLKRGISANAILTAAVVTIAIGIIVGALLVNRSNNGGEDAGSGGSQLQRHTLIEAADKKVTVVEFLDYQCPACASFYTGVTKQLERDYSGRITFVARNFPLEVHPLALPAARAAEAAAEQDKYSQMYHALYDNYRQWAVSSGGGISDDTDRAEARFEDYARAIGLDIDRFRRDAASPEIGRHIETDLADGARAGVTSTPGIFVNGKKFQPTGDSYADVDRQLRELLDSELKR
ncbi:MAG: DsbA family protein [Mycobacteriales bacterium]